MRVLIGKSSIDGEHDIAMFGCCMQKKIYGRLANILIYGTHSGGRVSFPWVDSPFKAKHMYIYIHLL